MLNHASHINRKRMDARIKRDRAAGKFSIQDDVADMQLVNGRKLTELTSEEIINAHEEAPRPRVIKVKKE